MPWRDACLPPDGVAGGNSPSGGDRGERESCKVRAGSMAGANLAHRSFISFPESVYSLIYSPIYSLTCSLIYSASHSATHPAMHTATYSATQIDFDYFHYIL